MIMEAKVNTKRGKDKKAMEQIKDGRIRVQMLINSVKDISNLWKFIGVFYVKDGSETDFRCSSYCSCRDFTIVNQSSIPSKLFNIDHKMAASHPDWNPQDHVNDFVELTKQLMFTFQGNPEAPILNSKVIERIGQEMDQACTIENIFFWTPEQLLILNAINEDFMVLFAYYGCGKTLLLKERAKHLLSQSGDKDIYFFIDAGCSPLLDALSAAFKNTRINVRRFKYGISGDVIPYISEVEGVKKNDHVIIDELVVYGSIDEMIHFLKALKNHFSSVWIAIGSLAKFKSDCLTGDPAEIRSEIMKISMCCPTFKHCLRNSRKILDLARSRKNLVEVEMSNLNILSDELEANNVNDGCVKELRIQSNWKDALKLGLEHLPSKGQSMIVVQDIYFATKPTFDKIRDTFSEKIWINFEDDKKRQKWFMSSEDERLRSIPVLANDFMVTTKINGLEFDSVLLLSLACSECNYFQYEQSLVTRAKVMLIFATYMNHLGNLGCSNCEQQVSGFTKV